MSFHNGNVSNVSKVCLLVRNMKSIDDQSR